MNLAECRGHWALVTGATSGIGREFCVQLAAAGLNVAMVARRKQSMEDLAAELRVRHGIRTLVVDQDLAVPGAAAAVRERVAGNRVAVRLLVNSAAFGPWGRFENFPAEHYERLIQLVATTPVSMCRVFHGDLRSFARSAIVNVSSPAALQPVPFMAAYASAKSCLHDFSLALHAEWKQGGVLVQTLVPGPTQSEFDSKAGAYRSALGTRRDPPARVVAASFAGLATDAALVSTARGLYRQRVFAGVFRTTFVVAQVARMFRPPDERN